MIKQMPDQSKIEGVDRKKVLFEIEKLSCSYNEGQPGFNDPDREW